MTERSQKELAKLGLDYVVQTILPVDKESLGRLSVELTELEKHDLEFTLGVIEGFLHSVFKKTNLAGIPESNLREMVDECLAGMKIENDDGFTTVSTFCGKCKKIFYNAVEFENHICVSE